MDNEIKELNESLIDQYISCKIESRTIDKGLIAYSKRYQKYYILQDKIDGSTCSDLEYKKFKYSWYVGKGDYRKLKEERVSNIKLLNNSPIIEVW